MNDSNWMASIAGKYQTVVTVSPPGSGGTVRVLPLNPRRYFLTFMAVSPATALAIVYPGPIVASLNNHTFATVKTEWKFSDCPSIVQGEFYRFDDGSTTIVLIESLYTGD